MPEAFDAIDGPYLDPAKRATQPAADLRPALRSEQGCNAGTDQQSSHSNNPLLPPRLISSSPNLAPQLCHRPGGITLKTPQAPSNPLASLGAFVRGQENRRADTQSRRQHRQRDKAAALARR